MPPAKKSAPDEIPFEAALARLEELVKEMEGGNLQLDRMMACFEEGSRLATLCEQRLKEVEKKIEMLVHQDGKTTTAPSAADKEDAP